MPRTRKTPGPDPSPATPPEPCPDTCPYRQAAEALQREAAAGSVRAILALADGAVARLLGQSAGGPDAEEDLPSHVAAAMLAAGDLAARLGPEATIRFIQEHLR